MHSSMMRAARLLTVFCSIGGVYPGGVYPGGCLPHCMLGYTPMWTEFLTHTCENINFPRPLLRAVILNYTPQLAMIFICNGEKRLGSPEYRIQIRRQGRKTHPQVIFSFSCDLLQTMKESLGCRSWDSV